MRQKITVLGSFVVDLMARTPHLPAAGETVRGSRFKQGAGGKGFNQGVAAHKAGGNVSVVTKLGRDALGQVALEAMDAVGMKKDFLFYSEDVETGVALILVDEHASQNEIVVVPGACATLSDEFLNGLFLVTPNEVEAEEMTGVKVDSLEAADGAAAVFFEKGVQNVLITLGGRGVYVNTDGASEILPAYRVDAVDTTGAGDAFNGALAAALAEGKTLRQAARFANAAAALSVQRIGTTPAMPDRAEIDAFLKERE